MISLRHAQYVLLVISGLLAAAAAGEAAGPADGRAVAINSHKLSRVVLRHQRQTMFDVTWNGGNPLLASTSVAFREHLRGPGDYVLQTASLSRAEPLNQPDIALVLSDDAVQFAQEWILAEGTTLLEGTLTGLLEGVTSAPLFAEQEGAVFAADPQSEGMSGFVARIVARSIASTTGAASATRSLGLPRLRVARYDRLSINHRPEQVLLPGETRLSIALTFAVGPTPVDVSAAWDWSLEVTPE